MKFRHTFHVFVDNFSVIYKQLLYRLIILALFAAIGVTSLYPFLKRLVASEALNNMVQGIKQFIDNFLDGNMGELAGISQKIKDAFHQIIEIMKNNTVGLVWAGLLLLVIIIIEKWFTGLGNFTTSVLVNDKMALRANSPFVGTLIRNIKKAALYNLIYVPLSILYDLALGVGIFTVLFFLVMKSGIGILVSIFIFTLMMIFSTSWKMTFTSDWLPALIRGKMSQRNAIKYTFSRKNKNTFNVLSNYIVMDILILGGNVAAFVFTFGVGLLISIPASFVVLICFELVNYYDREEIRYFADKNTIIKPEKEKILSREEFFTGTDD